MITVNEFGKYSFEFEGMNITNPYMDETGRFEVNPIEYYKLTPEELEKFSHLKGEGK